MDGRQVIEALRGPRDELRETHISWVLLRREDVVKLKKPVDFGFLDFTSLEKRKAACEAELALNRRLAPDVYLGVSDVTRSGDDVALGGDGETIEHAVRMRRLPDADRADARLARGELHDRHLRRAAETLARFHAQAETGPDIAANGSAQAVRRTILENFEQARPHLPRLLGEEAARELERWQLGFLEREAALFSRRAETGRVRDGHGDLRLEHLYFDEQDDLRILDCIEFSDRLRHIDVACDVAFLAMDLGVKGRVDLAERFLALYAEAADDHDLYALVDFYESYRAFVRGKIVGFALDGDLDAPTREAREKEARRFYQLALASERRALLEPTLVLVGGLIGTGKSTMAGALSERTGAPVVSSDRARKALAGAAPTERLGAEAYDEATTERVYGELLRRARVVLESGRSVIVDASFARAGHRLPFAELAGRLGVAARWIECRAPREAVLSRLEARAARGDAVSDAGPELYASFAERFDPFTEMSAEAHRVVETDLASPAETARLLEGFVPMWTSAADGDALAT